MIPGTGLGWRLQTGILNPRSFLKSSHHLEIPSEVFQMEYDIGDLLQNNSGHDGKWVETQMNQHRYELMAAAGDGYMEVYSMIFFLCLCVWNVPKSKA